MSSQQPKSKKPLLVDGIKFVRLPSDVNVVMHDCETSKRRVGRLLAGLCVKGEWLEVCACEACNLVMVSGRPGAILNEDTFTALADVMACHWKYGGGDFGLHIPFMSDADMAKEDRRANPPTEVGEP